MARIRSVHPSLWTDENFVSMPLAARLFLIGLWNEADDYGMFEWKPVTLKMRLAPADNVDAAELLEVISNNGFITKITRENKEIGVISNFRKFQKPKNPSAPIIPPDVEICALIKLAYSDIPSPHLPQDYPSPSEKSVLMEDGGDKMEDGIGGEKKGSGACAPDCSQALDEFHEVAEECGLSAVQKFSPSRQKKLSARLKDCGGLEGWRHAMAKIRGSPFLRGENERGWRANFDWIVKAENFTKLMEGAYDASSNARKSNGKTTMLDIATANGSRPGGAGPGGQRHDAAAAGNAGEPRDPFDAFAADAVGSQADVGRRFGQDSGDGGRGLPPPDPG